MIRVYLTEWQEGDPKNSKPVAYVNLVYTGKAMSKAADIETHEAEFRHADNSLIGRVEFEVKSTGKHFRILSAALNAAKKAGIL